MNKGIKKRVMAFGTFDHLHAGHEHYLSKASQLGDELIVIIARDQTARSIRGFNPENSEKKRLKNVQNLPFVTKAILGDSNDKYKVLRKFQPDVIALGYDQFIFTQNLSKILIQAKLDTQIVRLEPYHPEMYKSSLIRRDQAERKLPLEDATTAEPQEHIPHETETNVVIEPQPA